MRKALFISAILMMSEVEDAVRKMEFKPFSYQSLAAKPDYKEIFALASSIMEQYASGKLSRVYVIYHHFKSSAVQKVERLTYLPLEISSYKKEQKATADGWLNNYIVEPSVSQVIESLMPQLLKQKLYTCLADSYASEHAARTIAMQVATDNAEDLIQELTILYNKSRQQAITAELLTARERWKLRGLLSRPGGRASRLQTDGKDAGRQFCKAA